MKSNQKQNVGFEVRVLHNLIRRHIDSSGVRAEMESITGTNGWVIVYLAQHMDEDVYQRDLEQTFSVRRSTMSNILALMEKKDLIRRESVSHDARLKKLILTEKALNICERAKNDRESTEAIICEGIPKDDLATFMSVIDKMKKNLEKSDGPCELDGNHGPKHYKKRTDSDKSEEKDK